MHEEDDGESGGRRCKCDCWCHWPVRDLVEPVEGPEGATLKQQLAFRLSELVSTQQGSGTVIQGPIVLMNTVTYVFFLVVMLAAQAFGWAPLIRVYQTALYTLVVLVLLEITRFVNDELAIKMRLYMTLVPLAVTLAVSREAHVLLALIFYCIVFTIFLQSGIPRLRFHLMVFICLFISVYSLSVIFLVFFYRDTTGTSATFGRILDPQVNFSEEIFMLLSLALLGLFFLMVERYIKMFAVTLLRGGMSINKLEHANEALRHEISRFKISTQMDLDSPLTKVLNDMRKLASSMEVQQSSSPSEDDTAHTLLDIVQALTTNRLYVPDIDFTQGGVDAELGDFLENTLVAGTHKRQHNKKPSTTGAASSGSSPQGSIPGGLESLCSRELRLALPVLGPTESLVHALLRHVSENWDFSVFELSQLTDARPLYWLGLRLISLHGLETRLNISPDQLMAFLGLAEQGYNANPYHNALHATDVLQALHFLLVKSGLLPHMSDAEIFGALVAAIVHDIGHPGRNNIYLVTTQSPLAITYNDRAVLENFHCASAFRLMLNPDNGANILEGLTESQQRDFRETVVAMVLATDMSVHFDIVGQFKAKLSSPAGFDFSKRKDRLLLLQCAIKCADVSNSARARSDCERWAELVMEEFWQQGDDERTRGLPIGAFMDRMHPDVAKCQVGFISYIVGPLYQECAKVFGTSLSPCLANLEGNLESWQQMQQVWARQAAAAGRPSDA